MRLSNLARRHFVRLAHFWYYQDACCSGLSFQILPFPTYVLHVSLCRCPVHYCRSYSFMIATSTRDTGGCRDHERISMIIGHVPTTKFVYLLQCGLINSTTPYPHTQIPCCCSVGYQVQVHPLPSDLAEPLSSIPNVPYPLC
jgi:hypothetical protein